MFSPEATLIWNYRPKIGKKGIKDAYTIKKCVLYSFLYFTFGRKNSHSADENNK